MSEIDIFDGPSQPPVEVDTAPEFVQLESTGFCRRCYVLMAMCAVLAIVALRGCSILPIPTPTPIVDVDQPSVMFVLDGEQSLTPDQADVTISQKVHGYCDENGIAIRRVDIRDDLSLVEPQWQKMVEAAKSAEGGLPVMIIVDKDGNGKIKKLSNIDDTLAQLKNLD